LALGPARECDAFRQNALAGPLSGQAEQVKGALPLLEAVAKRRHTHIAEAPWWIVEAVDKKRARLNCIAHLLNQLPYEEIIRPEVVLPERV
jgi:hypothetical protein